MEYVILTTATRNGNHYILLSSYPSISSISVSILGPLFYSCTPEYPSSQANYIHTHTHAHMHEHTAKEVMEWLWARVNINWPLCCVILVCVCDFEGMARWPTHPVFLMIDMRRVEDSIGSGQAAMLLDTGDLPSSTSLQLVTTLSTSPWSL